MEFQLFLIGKRATEQILKTKKIDETIKQSDEIQKLLKAIRYYSELLNPNIDIKRKLESSKTTVKPKSRLLDYGK